VCLWLTKVFDFIFCPYSSAAVNDDADLNGMDDLFDDDYVLLQHQQQVATAVERAKQVTMTELNAIIGVSDIRANGDW
jgi:hypothetical protein